jgi:hypothetical protein
LIIDQTLGARSIQSPISFSSAGDNIVVSGVPGMYVKVLQFFLVVSGPTILTFKSNASLLSGGMSMLANGAIVLDYIQLPLQTTSPGDNFIINSSAGVSVGGVMWYMLQP